MRSGKLRRGKGLKRGRGLERGPAPKRKAPMKRGKGPKRSRKPSLPPKERIAAQEFYRYVMRACEQKCAVTGEKWAPRDRLDPLRLEAHHVIEKAVLKRRGMEHLLWDPDNGLAVTAGVHAGHTSAMKRIPRNALRAKNIEFARRHGFMDEIERKYPTRGGHDGR